MNREKIRVWFIGDDVKRVFLRVFIYCACLLCLTEKAYSWKEDTHALQLTPNALELLRDDDKAYEKDGKGRYDAEIWEHEVYMKYGSHDEDFPCQRELGEWATRKTKTLFPCRSINHYFHPISRSGLSDAPWVGKGDRDVGALEWAKSNPYFNSKEEFADGKEWILFKQQKARGIRKVQQARMAFMEQLELNSPIKEEEWTARDVDNGNMSWVKAIDRYDYTESSKLLAYYTLGFVLHVLQDMAVPEHVHDDPHGASSFTGFEEWVNKNYGNWEKEIKEKAKELAAKKYNSVDDYFINLAQIGYSIDRFKGGTLKEDVETPIDSNSDLARMFEVEYDLQVKQGKDEMERRIPRWILKNYLETSTMDTPNPEMKWSPEQYNSNPLWTKGHAEGEWWPTSEEIPGGKNDEQGFYYIELSGDFPELPIASPDPIRNLYPRAFLPTPLPAVEDQCQGWQKDENQLKVIQSNKERHLYTLIGKTILPYAVSYSAELIKFYYDIVNHPPYVKEVNVSQPDGTLKYSAKWDDKVKVCPGKNKIQCVMARSLNKKKDGSEVDELVKPGEIIIKTIFSEPVIVKEVRIGNQVISNGSVKDNDTVWSATYEIPEEGPESEILRISIEAHDKNNHYNAEGGALDKDPSTPARRLIWNPPKGGNFEYRWGNYEAGMDTNHSIQIDRGKLISINVTVTPDEVYPCGKVTFEARDGVYEFGDGEKKTMPLMSEDIKRIKWSWTGPHTVLEGKKDIWGEKPGKQQKILLGTASGVRVDRPESQVNGIAKLGEITGEAVVNVGTIPEESPLFKIEDVSTRSAVEVGESFQNRAVMFYCEGVNNPDYKLTTDVWWESDSPKILGCSSDGRCLGKSPGQATVQLFSKKNGRKGVLITSRPVEVYKKEREKQKDCKALRVEYLTKFYKMVHHYRKKHKSNYNVADFLGAYVSDIFPDKYCDDKVYVNCGIRLVDEYYECLVKCNEQWQREIKTPGELRNCRGRCNQTAGTRKEHCLGMAKTRKEDEGRFSIVSEGETKPKDEGRFSIVSEGETKPHIEESPSVRRSLSEQQNELCRKLNDSLQDARASKNITRFRLLLQLQYAKDCDFYQDANNFLQEWERDEQRDEFCSKLDADLKHARDLLDIDQFRSLLQLPDARDCGFYQDASNFLREWERDYPQARQCNELFEAFEKAFYQQNISLCRSILDSAVNCDFYQQAADLIRDREQNEQRAEQCNELAAHLRSTYSARDIDRFRFFLQYAKDCGFYQEALADLRFMERSQPDRSGSIPIGGRCGEVKREGSDRPETHEIELGKSFGTFLFQYETYTKKDRITVVYQSQLLFDSGCVGTNHLESTYLRYSGNSSKVRVTVYPNCAGEHETKWKFIVHCPD